MTINEENFIEELRDFLNSKEVTMEATGVTEFCFKGPDIWLDLEDVYEEL